MRIRWEIRWEDEKRVREMDGFVGDGVSERVSGCREMTFECESETQKGMCVE